MAFDSEQDALTVQRDVWRRMGPVDRVRLSVRMSEEARRIALIGAMRREHKRSEAELRRKLIRVLYGIEGPTDPTR